MTARDSDSRTPRDRERAYWRERLQDYVDGTLDDREALRLHLFAERDGELAAELARTRKIFAALDAAPVQEPSPAFDEQVLAAIPYEKYTTAPRRPERMIVLGDDSLPLHQRVSGRLRSGLTALAVAYVLFLAVSHSALRDMAVGLARWTGDGLASLAARTQELPVLSDVVGFMARAYDAGVSWIGSVAATTGEGLLTFVLGLVLGAIALAIHQGVRRRNEARRPQP